MSKVGIADSDLDSLMQEVESLSKEEVSRFLESYQHRVQSRRDYNKRRNMTDDQKAKRAEYNKKRRDREKQIIAKAKEMGLL